MSCEKFDQRLQHLLDLRAQPSDDRELQQHAQHCGDCHEKLTMQQSLFASLRMDVPPLREDFSRRVVETYLAERPASAANWTRSPWTLLFASLAALALIAMWPTLRTATNTPSSNPQVAQKPGVDSDVEKAAPPAIEIAAQKTSPQVASPQVVTTPGQLDDSRALASAQTSGLGSGEWIDSLRESISEVSLETLEPMDPITEGFRPVATSLQTAVDALRRTLPGGKDQRHKLMPDTSGLWNNSLAVS